MSECEQCESEEGRTRDHPSMNGQTVHLCADCFSELERFYTVAIRDIGERLKNE
jgi:hypothetical protein